MSAVAMDEIVVSKLSLIKERVIYALIFLFPIAGVGVRHWFSGIFSILVLMSFWDMVKPGVRAKLFREEKIWLWLCAGFFVTYLLSSTVNGWTDTQTHYFGKDVRFLVVVPLYLMLRTYQDAWRYLLAGLMLAAVFIAGQAYYETMMLHKTRAEGVYSPNLLGPVAALIAVWLLASWREWAWQRWSIPVLVIAALWAVVMSGSRGAYLGTIVMCLVWGLLYFRGWWKVLPVVVVLLAPLIAYQASDRFAQRVDEAVGAVSHYIEQVEKGDHNVSGTAVRFEMWHVGWLIFKDNPVFGVGRGNYTEAAKEYVGTEGVPQTVAHHGHAHNAYVDVIIARGLIGFVVFLGMLFYPLYYFFRTRHLSPDTALFGILHIVGFAVFSITDASTFIKGNFIAIYLVCMSVFLFHHVAVIKKQGS